MTRATTATAPPVPVDDPLWSARKVREFLDTSDKWLRRRLSCGRFPVPDARFGRAMRWRRSTIESFICENIFAKEGRTP